MAFEETEPWLQNTVSDWYILSAFLRESKEKTVRREKMDGPATR